MRNRLKIQSTMVQALTILSALQLFSEGVPGADGSGEPYGISRGVVEGAARAGLSLNPQPHESRELDLRPGVPALSQVSPTSEPSNRNSNDGVDNRGEAKMPELPPCNNGRGVLRFERLSDVRRAPSSSDSDVVRLSEIPADVLFKCQEYCLKDETSSQSRKQLCGSLDFVPGKRYTKHTPTIEYTESKCFLTMPDQNPSQPPKYEQAKDFYHYREVCYSGAENEASTTVKDCPERMYVMERVMGKRFMPKDIKEVNANSLEECEQICLNQAAEDPLMATSVCRSGSFDHQRQRCYLSTYSRRTHTNEFIDDPIYDYFENTCLNVERRCPRKKLFWTKEVNAEMTGPYDFIIYQNMTLEACKTECLNCKSTICRSLEFDERLRTCVLSDEDSISRPQHIKQSASDQNIYLELTCIDGYHMDAPNQIGTGNILDRQHLTDRNLREVQTAFQLFRNRRLELSPGFREQSRKGGPVSLAECLDACLEERNFQCRSVIYSDRQKSCQLSEFDQINGNLEFDPDFHYFENLMSGRRLDPAFSGGSRPFNSLSKNDGGGRFRPDEFSNNRFGGSRFQNNNRGGNTGDSGGLFSSGGSLGGGLSSSRGTSGGNFYNSGGPLGGFSSGSSGGFPSGSSGGFSSGSSGGSSGGLPGGFSGGSLGGFPSGSSGGFSGGSTGGGNFFNSGGSASTGIPLPIGGAFNSGGSFSSGATRNRFPGADTSNGLGGSENRFSSSENRFSSDRGGSSGFGSSGASFNDQRLGGNRGTTNRFDSDIGGDRFSNAFNRFHENTLTGGGGSSINSRVSSAGIGDSSRNRVTGLTRFGGGNANSGAAVGFNRRGESASGGGNRFSGSNNDLGFGGSEGIRGGSTAGLFGAGGFTGSFGAGGSSSAFGRPGFGGSSGNAITDDVAQGTQNSPGRLSGSGSYGGSYAGGSSNTLSSFGSSFGSRPGLFGSSGNSRPFSGGSGSSFGSSTFGLSHSNFGQRPSSFDLRPSSFGSGLSFGSGSNFDSGSKYRPIDARSEIFEPVGSRQRLRSQYIRRYVTVDSLNDCKEECINERSFACMSFNYRYARNSRTENCELSTESSRSLDIQNPSYFETDGEYDFFERQEYRPTGGTRPIGGGKPPFGGGDRPIGGGAQRPFGGNNWSVGNGRPLDVSQQCNPDGSMEFMLRTTEPFRGRIYTFGHYVGCFYRGGGSTVNMLKITPERGFPDCGTKKYGDTTTNIVVVQFADGVMTSMDKRYNLTCTTIGPGDALVTSAYIGAGLGAPVPIEYLPEESRLDSQVRLQILYSGHPTTTVAVGDPLTFRIESLAGRGLVNDIFATNVVARDPISGRAIELIDSRGCPVQLNVFPALGRSRSGDGLETKFSAFKLPGANMVLFEALVKLCRGQCEPAVCNAGRGRSELYSYGKRKRRSATDEGSLMKVNETEEKISDEENPSDEYFVPNYDDEPENDFEGDKAKINEVLRVYMNEDDAQDFRDVEAASLVDGFCIPPSQYYSLLSALLISILCLLASVFIMGLCYRKHRKLANKNENADASNPLHKTRSAFPGSHPRTVNQPARYFPSRDDRGHSTIDLDSRKNRFPDPSEPIYTDPTLFERSPEGSSEETSARL